ncbi:hypothetical protein Leryth_000012 [Lithospermum erythrorhizon]|nr:hypothetical protein Leryth_000012 [Lithospermum erythrorhizon]
MTPYMTLVPQLPSMEDKDDEFVYHKFFSVSEVVDELKELWSMALPITAMNLLVYVRAVVSVLFLGRLGSLELAGGALSIGFTNITGKKMGIRFLLVLPPDLNLFVARHMGVTKPQMWCTLVAVIFHVPLNYALVMLMGWGVPGVAMASVLTNLHMAVLLMGYVYLYGRLEWKWKAGIGGVCGGMGPLLKLAVPSCISICLEWWWYEIVTVLAGYLPNPRLTVAATGIVIQTTSLMYTVPMALAGCVSARTNDEDSHMHFRLLALYVTQLNDIIEILCKCSNVTNLSGRLVSWKFASAAIRVGNELGAGKPYKAKLAALAALGCAFVIGLFSVIWTIILREKWGGIFTKDEMLKAVVASILPIIGLCELGNCPQTTGCGILRGTARPAVGARINLCSFYLVGTPIAVGLAFYLEVGFSGLWFGLLSAQVVCAISILYVVVICTNWESESFKAMKLTNLEMRKICDNAEETTGLLAYLFNDSRNLIMHDFLLLLKVCSS